MRHKKSLILLVIILGVVLIAFGGYNVYRYPALFHNLSDETLSEQRVEELKMEILSKPDAKTLVAYFSYSGTTKDIANAISEKIGTDLFEIAPKEWYSNVYPQSNSEIRFNKHPELANNVENIDRYDIVFVGFPIWWHATPAPVNTFLESYDLSGKLIIPFCTSGGSDIKEAMPTFLNSCKGLAVYGEKRLIGGQIDNWLEELGLFTSETETSSPVEESPSMPDEVQSTEISAEVSESLSVYEYEQREIDVMNDGKKIYGVALIPKNAAERVPLVICAHGLGGNYRTNMSYAEQLASHGIAAYCFDFRGGGGNMSDGATTEMSVMTEVSDLEAILEAAQRWDFADAEQISLLGTSQGGIVSAITAARHKNEIAGLVLLYPAFLVSDELHKRFDSIDDVPESFWLNWITAGRRYAEDMWDYDVYEEIKNYENNVLLIHGSADNIVPLSYSEKALETYRSARLEVLPGAGHGFYGQEAKQAIAWIFEYLETRKNDVD